MQRKVWLGLAVLLMVMGGVATCAAQDATPALDEITTKQGDVLKGTVKKIDAGKLWLQTIYAGDPIILKLSQVDRIRTHGPVEVAGPKYLGMGTLRVEDNKVYVGDHAESLDGSTVPGGPVDDKDAKWRGQLRVRFSGWTTTLKTDLTYTRGNSDIDKIGGEVSRKYRSASGESRQEYAFKSSYESVDGSIAKRTYLVTGRGENDIFDKDWYSYYDGELENDLKADIELRTAPAVGIGYHAYKSGDGNSWLDIEGGPAYQNINRYTGTDESGMVGRFGLEGGFSVGRWEVCDTFSLYGLFGNSGRTSRNEVVAKYPIGDAWKLTLTNTTKHQSEPSVGNDATDNTLCFGVEFEK